MNQSRAVKGGMRGYPGEGGGYRDPTHRTGLVVVLALAVLGSCVFMSAAHAELVYSSTLGAGYAPLDGASVSGAINIRREPCVVPTEFRLDGVLVNSEFSCPAEFIGDSAFYGTDSLTEGLHVITGDSESATFTVDNVPDPPMSLTFTAAKYVLSPGESTTISWTADRERARCSAPLWGADLPNMDSIVVTPVEDTEYRIDCVEGDSSAGAALTVLVRAPVRAPLPVNWPLKLKAKLTEAPGGGRVLFWATDTPRGVHHYALFFKDFAAALDWAGRGLLTKAEYDAAFNEQSVEMTVEQHAYAYGPFDPDQDGDEDSLIALYGVRVVAAPNGTSLSRPVYAANADGTRNTTAVAGARVAVGAQCRPGDRLIDLAGKGTKYYSVEGADNVSTPATDTLGRVFTLCNRTDPIGVN